MSVHKLIKKEFKERGLAPAMIVFSDKADLMSVASIVDRADWLRFLAITAVFIETGRPGTEEQVVAITAAIRDLLNK